MHAPRLDLIVRTLVAGRRPRVSGVGFGGRGMRERERGGWVCML